jgi:serine protease AprX
MRKRLIVGLVLAVGLAAGGAREAAAQPKPLVKLSRAELKNAVLYDAWIEFKDKGNLSARERGRIFAELEKTLDPKALARRKANLGGAGGGLFDDYDLPLVEKYLAGVEAAGAKVQVRSRWLNGVTVIVDKGAIEKAEKLPYVKAVTDFHLRKPRQMAADKPAPPEKKPAAKAPAQKPAGERTQPRPQPVLPPPSPLYGQSSSQVRVLNLGPLHAAGYTGKGVRIAVVDCGFELTSEAFHHPEHPLKVVAQYDFVENDGEVTPRPGIESGNYEHGTLVLGTIAAYRPGVIVGTGYDAEFILADAEDGDEEYYLEERWFVAGLEFVEARGADIVTSSLVVYDGYTPDQTDGKTAVMTRGFNIAAAKGMICFAGSGNDGNDTDPKTRSLMPPADGFDVIGVGAVDALGRIARFSSDGPSADGRLKPEVMSMGLRVASVAIGDPKGVGYASGTSLSTPVLAGAGACLLQAHPGWTVKQFRKALFESGDYWRREGRTDPLFVQGYGIPDVYRAAGMK